MTAFLKKSLAGKRRQEKSSDGQPIKWIQNLDIDVEDIKMIDFSVAGRQTKI